MTELHQVSPQTLREVMQIHRQEIELYENQIRNLESKQYRETQEMQESWDKCKKALHRELKRNEELTEKTSQVKTLEKKVLAYEQRIEKIKAILTPIAERSINLPEWFTELRDAVGGFTYKGAEQ